MKVLLRMNVDNVGQAGEVVDVKPGFARNYLVPQGKALMFNKSNQAGYENEKRQAAARLAKEKHGAELLAKKLEDTSVEVAMAVGEEDKLFGSVTSQDIAEYLLNQGIEIDKRKIVLEEPIKALGLYTVDVKLHPDVPAKVKVWVVKK